MSSLENALLTQEEKEMLIDIHAHANPFPQFAPPYPQGQRFVSPAEVVELYDKLNVECGVLLPLVVMLRGTEKDKTV